MKYRIEILQLGDLIAQGEYDRLEDAQAVYRRYIHSDHLAVEVYVDGRRLKIPEGWRLMCGWDGYTDFLYGEALKEGEHLWQEDAN